MVDKPKYFSKDHMARDEIGKPIARVVMVDSDYVEGENIKVAVVEIPKVFNLRPKGLVLYIDGDKYKIPENIPDLKITNTINKILVNNFYLERLL